MITNFQLGSSLVPTFFLILLLSAGSALAQDSVDYYKGGQYTCRDSTVLLGGDSIKIVYGSSSSLGLRFWSRDLFLSIEQAERYSDRVREHPRQGLYRFFPEAYLADTPDTSHWQTYYSSHFGLSFRHPPGLQVIERLDSFSQQPVIDLKVRARPDSLGHPSLEVLPLARISFTSESFVQVAVTRGWHPLYPDCWYMFREKELSETELSDIAYLEGNQWKCVRALQSFPFYDENNSMGIGDSLKFVAVIERPPEPSLVLDLFNRALVDSPVYIFEEEWFTLLSSVRFRH